MSTSKIQRQIRRFVAVEICLASLPIALPLFFAPTWYGVVMGGVLLTILPISVSRALNDRKGNALDRFVLSTFLVPMLSFFVVGIIGILNPSLLASNQSPSFLEFVLMIGVGGLCSGIGLAIYSAFAYYPFYGPALKEYKRPTVSSIASLLRQGGLIAIIMGTIVTGVLVKLDQLNGSTDVPDRSGQLIPLAMFSFAFVIIGAITTWFASRRLARWSRFRTELLRGENQGDDWKLTTLDEGNRIPEELPRLTKNDANPNTVLMKRVPTQSAGGAYRSSDHFEPWALVEIPEQESAR